MRRALKVINSVTVAGGVLLLVLSLWPGYAGGFLAWLAYPLIFLLGLAWMIVALNQLRPSINSVSPLPARQILAAPLGVGLTLALLLFYVPRRVAFPLVRAQFEQHLSSATASTDQGKSLGWVGIYRVDQYAADPRGGVYFRTAIGPDGWGPTRISYGFVYRPNDRGTPFGAARYRVWSLSADWFWFRASDDWY